MRHLLAVLMATLLLVSCGSEEVAPSPDALVDQAAGLLATTEGFVFRVTRDGEPAEIGGWLIRGLAGTYQAPASADARVKVKVGGLIVETGIVSIGDQTWQQDPLTGEWTELPPDSAITVVPVFGKDGLSTILSNDLTDISYIAVVALEDLPGEALHHVTAVIDATRLNTITSGLMPGGVKPADLYFSESGELRRVSISDDLGTWHIDAWDYGPGHLVVPPA